MYPLTNLNVNMVNQQAVHPFGQGSVTVEMLTAEDEIEVLASLPSGQSTPSEWRDSSAATAS